MTTIDAQRTAHHFRAAAAAVIANKSLNQRCLVAIAADLAALSESKWPQKCSGPLQNVWSEGGHAWRFGVALTVVFCVRAILELAYGQTDSPSFYYAINTAMSAVVLHAVLDIAIGAVELGRWLWALVSADLHKSATQPMRDILDLVASTGTPYAADSAIDGGAAQLRPATAAEPESHPQPEPEPEPEPAQDDTPASEQTLLLSGAHTFLAAHSNALELSSLVLVLSVYMDSLSDVFHVPASVRERYKQWGETSVRCMDSCVISNKVKTN